MAYSYFVATRLNFVKNSFRNIYGGHSSLILAKILNKIEKLNGEEMSDDETMFILKIYRLLESRDKFSDKIYSAHFNIFAVCFLLFCFISFLSWKGEFWFTLILWLISSVMWIIFHFSFSELRWDGSAGFERLEGIIYIIATSCYEIIYFAFAGNFMYHLSLWFLFSSLWGAFCYIFSDFRPDGAASMGRWDGFAYFILIGCSQTIDFILTRGIIWGCFGVTISYGVSRYIAKKYLIEITDECVKYFG